MVHGQISCAVLRQLLGLCQHPAHRAMQYGFLLGKYLIDVQEAYTWQ